MLAVAVFHSCLSSAAGGIVSAPRKKPLMLRIFALSLSLFILAIDPALAQAPSEATQVSRIFDVVRDGTKIGTDTIEIDTNGDTITVKFTTHISVVIMFIEAYRYEHSATETWTAGQFVSYKSRTNDNGKKHSLSAIVVDDKLDLTVDGKQQELPHVVLPASLWNNDFINQTELFDTDTSTSLSIKVKDMGDEPITLHGTKITTHHYKITGDLARDLWLDGDVPVRIKLLGSDRSKIVSTLRR